MATRKNESYKDGELETILSLVPTEENIARLSELLDRSKRAIEIVYTIAYRTGRMGEGIQRKKVMAAKKAVGIRFGPRR